MASVNYDAHFCYEVVDIILQVERTLCKKRSAVFELRRKYKILQINFYIIIRNTMCTYVLSPGPPSNVVTLSSKINSFVKHFVVNVFFTFVKVTTTIRLVIQYILICRLLPCSYNFIDVIHIPGLLQRNMNVAYIQILCQNFK